MKDKKLERDRRFSKKNSPANLQATSKPKVKYSDIIKKHIRNQIRQTSQNKSPESDNQARNIHHDPPLRRKQHLQRDTESRTRRTRSQPDDRQQTKSNGISNGSRNKQEGQDTDRSRRYNRTRNDQDVSWRDFTNRSRGTFWK